MISIPLQWLIKGFLWFMLLLASLGAVATLLETETDPTPAILQQSISQQKAIHAALAFTREWMHWDVEEPQEERINRLRPYVSNEAMPILADLQGEEATLSQGVIATEFVSINTEKASHTVRVRVIVRQPERAVWEVDVPVWVQGNQRASISGPPLIRLPEPPPTIVEADREEPTVSSSIRQRMVPAMERFLIAMLEETDADSLFNYVTAESRLVPFEDRVRFISLDHLEATGTGPYKVTVTFKAQDRATGFMWTQKWEMEVIEENQKFFVHAVDVP